VPELADTGAAAESTVEAGAGESRDEALRALGLAFRGAFRSLRSLRGRDTHRVGQVGHAQYELLGELRDRGPIPAGELAEAIGVSAATVSGMLDHLCDAGLTARTRSANDRRLVVVKITPKGRRKSEARRTEWRARWDEALEGVEEEELRVAIGVLERISTVFEERR
jgi:MarR family transcriptional regulator, organic hydroperoxide resistance regulator